MICARKRRRAMADHYATPTNSALYKRPLQVWRYLRQFPSPRSPNSSLLRQACRNSAHASLRTGRWQVSRYLRQFPSPRSPSTSLFSQARRNCSHSPPPIRTPPGPTSIDWEEADTGITKRAAAAAAPSEYFRIPCNIPDPPSWCVLMDFGGRSRRYGISAPATVSGAHLNGSTVVSPLSCTSPVDYRAAWNWFHSSERMRFTAFSSQMRPLDMKAGPSGPFRDLQQPTRQRPELCSASGQNVKTQPEQM